MDSFPWGSNNHRIEIAKKALCAHLETISAIAQLLPSAMFPSYHFNALTHSVFNISCLQTIALIILSTT
jgi:hypothetical protein